jgi:hypothetical protein
MLLAALAAPANAGPDYTFENPGISPFSETSDGLTATFTTTAGSGQLLISANTFLAPFAGNALFDKPASQFGSNPLIVSFNKGVHGVNLDFGLYRFFGSNDVTLKAFSGGLNGTLVGTVTATATPSTVPNTFGGFGFGSDALFPLPEGVLSFASDTPFDTIEVVAPSGMTFAIDNLLVSVPEPGGLTLAGVTVLGICVGAWKRRRHAN